MSDNLNIFIFYIWCCGRRLPNKAQRLDHDRANAPQRFADWRSVCEALELCGWTNCRQCAVRRSLFFVRWDLRILIRNENEKQKFKP